MNLQQLRVPVLSIRETPSLLRAAGVAIALVILPLFLFGNPLSGVPASGAPQATQEAPTAPSDAAIPAAVEHVKLMLDQGNPALEIITTAPVKPQISTVNGMRLVIDLPNTNMSVPDKVVPIKNRDLSELRMNLHDTTPPTVHIEVDFRKPLGYTWDASANRLVFSFHHIDKQDAAVLPPLAPSVTPMPVSAPAPAANFANVVSEDRIASGSPVTAESETTVLRLKRAGDVYVCPRTTVSVVRSAKGPDVMLALNDGGLETHLSLRNSADEVVTPDFRILLRGPGEFHYAIRADSRGNTCVRSLPGNTASAIIYELIGNGTYQVQANDQMVFHNGKVTPANPAAQSDANTILPVECGCPPPSRQLLASNMPEPQIAAASSSADSAPVQSRPDVDPPLTTKPVVTGNPVSPEAQTQIPDLPQALRDQTHVQVDASLTFTPNPARTAARNLPASSREVPSPLAALPPSPPATPERHKSVFGKIKNFFSQVFH